ncbi:hypothetical protein [Halovenus halobia]|uniref:hypothetical protein n=1 Tax=Halovenus halobia TaxID=3396622 RepID=UPI003F55BC87
MALDTTLIDLRNPNDVDEYNCIPEWADVRLPGPIEYFQQKNGSKLYPGVTLAIIQFALEREGKRSVSRRDISQLHDEHTNDTYLQSINYLDELDLIEANKRTGGYRIYLPRNRDPAPVYRDETVEFDHAQSDTTKYRAKILPQRLLKPLLWVLPKSRDNQFFRIGDQFLAFGVFVSLAVALTPYGPSIEMTSVSLRVLWAILSFATVATIFGVWKSVLEAYSTVLPRIHNLLH